MIASSIRIYLSTVKAGRDTSIRPPLPKVNVYGNLKLSNYVLYAAVVVIYAAHASIKYLMVKNQP